jgi:hypothetical protein
MQDQIGGILPVLIIFTLVCYPLEMAHVLETSLGKLFFISLILYYSSIDIVYGIFTCVLVLVYYQIGYLDHVRSIERNRLIQESMATLQSEFKKESGNVVGMHNKDLISYTTLDSSVFSYEPYECATKEDVLLEKDRQLELKAIFRKEHCNNGQLGLGQGPAQGIKHELAEHIAFPLSGNRVSEIRFDDDFAKCNPCDPRCGFSIRSEQLRVDEKLTKPIESRTWSFHEIFEKVDFRPIDSMIEYMHKTYQYFVE